MKAWPSTTLSSLVENGDISYGIVQPGAHDPDGIPIIRVQDLANRRIATSNPLRVSPDVSARHKRTILRGGELLVSIVGTVGLVAVVPPELAGWNVARAIAVIRPAEVSAEWLKLCLTSRAAIDQMTSVLNTTVQATLNLSDLKAVAIPMPPREVRSAVTSVVAALDDKIAANRQVVDSCSELARVYWKSTASEARPLSALARFVNGRAFTKGASGTGRVVIRIAELNSGLGASTVYNDIEVADEHVARPGDLLFAWSGSLTVARWYRPEAIINQHIFKVIPSDGIPMWLVDQAVRAKLADYRAIAADKATTMGHIQRAHLDQPVLIPPPAEIDRLDYAMQSLWDRELAAEIETVLLEKTRDELLPLLMSGKVTVRDLPDSLTEVAP